MTNLGGTGVSENTDFDDEVTALLARQDRLNPLTLAAWQADPRAQLDDVVTTAERTAGFGGGGTGDVIASGTETGFKIVKHNTLPLSWELRDSEIINVRTYGALDDEGATDSRPAILAALTDGSIDLDGGSYGFKNPIDLEFSDRIIRGNGATLSYTSDWVHTRGGVPLQQLYFFNIGTQGDAPLPQTTVPVSNVRMTGITFDGTQPASISDGDTILKSVMVEIASGSSDIDIEWCHFLKPRSFSPSRGAVFARSGSSKVRINKCRSTNPDETAGEGGGGFVISGSDCKLTKCYMENLRDSAIGFDDATNSLCSGNTVVLNTVDGSGNLVSVGNSMQLTDGASGNTIVYNTFNGFIVGLEVSQIGGSPIDVHHNLIAHNIFNGGSFPSDGTASLAIRLGDIARDNEIDDNIIFGMSNKGDGSACIQLFPNNNKVTNNKISDLDAEGNRETGGLVDGIHIRFDDNPKKTLVATGNEISVGRRAIHLSSGDYLDTKHMIIENNPLNANTTDGLNTSLAGVEISNTGTKFIRINNNDFIGVFSSDWSGTWEYIGWFQAPYFSHRRPLTKIGYDNKVLYRNNVPSTATWDRLDVIIDTTPTAGEHEAWKCLVSGTDGTLNSGATTGSITTGTPDLVVNSANGLSAGKYISIVGVSGTKKVTSIVGTAVTIDSNADATVSGAAVSYSASTFKGFGLIEA